MIGKINSTRHLQRSLLYNEKKVEAKNAVLVDAGFYLVDPARLTLQQKLARLKERMLLNERSKVNVINISLSFHPHDRLTDLQLRRVASLFLKEMGLGKQPYLAYEHFDTAQRHMHIVSTLIRSDGSRIKGTELSFGILNRALAAVEAAFNLKNARSYHIKTGRTIAEANGSHGRDNKSLIKAAINEALQHYSFSSFSEYNAILKQFNVQALRGREGSRLLKLGGLLYISVDHLGKQRCLPIKASNLDARAIMKALKAEYFFIRPAQLKNLSRLKNTVDLALIQNRGERLDALTESLARQGVKLHVFRENMADELVLTYLDNRTKCAFDAQMLGENYSLKALLDSSQATNEKSLPLSAGKVPGSGTNIAGEYRAPTYEALPTYLAAYKRGIFNMLLEDLLAAAAGYNPVPYPLRKPAKKRRQRRL